MNECSCIAERAHALATVTQRAANKMQRRFKRFRDSSLGMLQSTPVFEYHIYDIHNMRSFTRRLSNFASLSCSDGF